MSRTTLTDLPFWPRYLSREEAARYVGVSTAVFETEVARGIWPSAMRRGSRGGGPLTWDRIALDKAADRASGLEEAAGPVASSPAISERDAAFWMEKLDATFTRKPTRKRPPRQAS